MRFTPEASQPKISAYKQASTVMMRAFEIDNKDARVVKSADHASYVRLRRSDDPSLEVMLQVSDEGNWNRGITLYEEEKCIDHFGMPDVRVNTYLLTPDGKAYSLATGIVRETMQRGLVHVPLDAQAQDQLTARIAGANLHTLSPQER
jgi:hypothetical protein